MRIAVVTTSWPAGQGDPSGHFVAAEARALTRQGHDVVVLKPTAGGAFGWPGVVARLRERPGRAIEAARWVAASCLRVGRIHPDRVVAHWAVPCAFPIAFGARHAAIEAVSHGADVRLLTAIPGPARRSVVGAIASRAERWRFASETLLSELMRTLDRGTRVRVERIAVVESASMEMPDVTEAIASCRRALGDLRVAVSVGRLVPGKRVDLAIDHVARTRGVDALVVVGDGPELERLARHASERRVDARFVGLVAREVALAWIGAAHVLLHASEAEGQSTVLREAEALGTPIEVLSPLRE